MMLISCHARAEGDSPCTRLAAAGCAGQARHDIVWLQTLCSRLRTLKNDCLAIIADPGGYLHRYADLLRPIQYRDDRCAILGLDRTAALVPHS